MELAGAIDSQCIGEDAGQVSSSHRSFSSASCFPFILYLSHTSCKCWHCASDKWHGRTTGDPCAERPHHGSGLHSTGTVQTSLGAAHSPAGCLLQDIFGLTALSVLLDEGNWRGCRFQRAFSCLRQCKAGMSIAHLQHRKGYLSCIQSMARCLSPKLNKYCYFNFQPVYGLFSHASESPRGELRTKLNQGVVRNAFQRS